MTRALGRAVAAGLLGALAAVMWLALFYGLSPALRIHFDRDVPRALISGVYPPERDPTSGLTFAWTSEELRLRLPDVNRQADWILAVRARGARRDAAENPELSFYVDGVRVLTHQSAPDFEELRAFIPARPDRPGVTIAMRASSTFVPGPSDPRALGVMLDSVALTPTAVVLPPARACAGVALAAGLAGAMMALLGVTAGSAVGSVLLLSAGLAALAARGLGPYTDFAFDAARAALWIGVVTVALTAGARLIRRQPLRNTATFAVAFTASTLLLKLLVLLHPDMPIGDALFHAHRFQDVLGGTVYFTSVAPGNYLFPYAPGLYLFAAPFADLVRRGAADMTLLRTIVCSADAAAGLLLYGMLVHARDRVAGAFAVALFHLIPLGFGVVATGNLTNAFAQSLAVAALAGVACAPVRFESRLSMALLAAILAAAFLTHTSTFAIVPVAICLVAVLFWWRGGTRLRRAATAVLVALVAAVLAAVLLYYAHFLETYRTELARIGAETATAAPDAGGRSIAGRLAAVPAYLRAYFGVPVLALACFGAVQLRRRGSGDRLALTTAGWAITCLAFLIVGILTPVDMRYYLAAIPIVALVAAVGARQAWAAGGALRVAATLLLSWALFIGIHAWWSTLG